VSDPELTPTQRAAAIQRARENLALLSGAGCGKTLVLAQRFTELVMNPRERPAPLRRLVALTFTEKAALEMSQRVYQLVKSRGDQAREPSTRRQLLAMLEQLPQARIQTIHSFCAAVLRSYAVEAGLDPNFSVLADEAQGRRMLDQAIEQALLEALEGGQAGPLALMEAMPLDRLADRVADVLKTRPACRLEDYVDAQENLRRLRRDIPAIQQQRWEQGWADGLAQELARLEAVRCGSPSDKLYQHRQEALSLVRQMMESPVERTMKNLSALRTSGNVGSQANWGGRESLLKYRRSLNAFTLAVKELEYCLLPLAEADEQATTQLAVLVQLSLRAQEIYDQAKRSAGLLDFTDLLARTGELIRNHAPVRRELAEGISQLLVDECQDTDAYQVQMLLRLVAGISEDGELPPGRLFLVGDDKQSIYRFRGAQVEVFRQLCRRLGPARQEHLDVSFRSHKALTTFINHVFSRLMSGGYQGVEAFRQQAPAEPAVEILLARSQEGQVNGYQESIRLQARLAAQRIAEMVARSERLVWDSAARDYRPVQYGDIAILFSRMTRSLDFERELALRDVPYYVVAGTGFFKQQEIYDLLNALRVVDNPADDLALAGVLRSSLFGLDDEALMHVFEHAARPVLAHLEAARLRDVLRPDQWRSLALAARLLGQLHRVKDALGADELLRRLVLATGYEAVLLSQFQGPRMVGNVRRLIEQAASASAAGLSLSAFVEVADELVLNEQRYEQAAVADEKDNVVRLMTIHKAKGLEFPVVFLVDLNAARRNSTDTVIHRPDVGLVFGGAQAADEDNGEADTAKPQATAYRVAQQLEKQDEAAEDIRRLYVGATRAQDHLVLVGADWRTKDGEFAKSGSALCLLDLALDLRAGLESPAKTLAYDGYRARLEAVSPEPAARPARKSPGQALLAESSGPDDLARRLIAQADRAGRAATPLLGPLEGQAGQLELAVTALEDFAACPMLYRWHHELRCPPPAELDAPPSARESSLGPLDPLTLGSVLHLCMERLDMDNPQPGALAVMALAELGLEDLVDPRAVAGQLGPMMDVLKAQPLWAEMKQARQAWRELEFSWHAGSAVLRGKIDLLYEDAQGRYHLVDYKSDRLSGGVAEHAQRYRFQMLLYAAAAQRYLAGSETALERDTTAADATCPSEVLAAPDESDGARSPGGSDAKAAGKPAASPRDNSLHGRDARGTHGQDARATPRLADATLYFLRSGDVYRFDVQEPALRSVQAELAELAARLAAARRSGEYSRSAGPHCPRCPYGRLCDYSHSMVAGGLDEMS
jgi:ATP-dependent helicase/nuclease subunit A